MVALKATTGLPQSYHRAKTPINPLIIITFSLKEMLLWWCGSYLADSLEYFFFWTSRREIK